VPIRAWEIRGGLAVDADPLGIASALRRAVMALAQEARPGKRLSPAFSGHSASGGKAENAPRFAFALDAARRRVLTVAIGPVSRADLAVLDELAPRLSSLRAGAGGLLDLEAQGIEVDDPLLAAATTWTSVTAYAVNRHLRADSAHDAIAADLRNACAIAGLPRPEVEVHAAWSAPRIGLMARATLRFAVAVPGPLLLGKRRFSGAGLFAGAPSAP
jgi:CRISPR-associated protein Csb2